jgi:TonB-dependent receptor
MSKTVRQILKKQSPLVGSKQKPNSLGGSNVNNSPKRKTRFNISAVATAIMSVSGMAYCNIAYAQEAEKDTEKDVEVIQVSGIRASLSSALQEKRSSDNLIEVIQAQDIGKLPDQNLAEVLENVTGIQITREAGVGSSVQIRGTDENRIEINGVTTIGSGSGRGGISFEDLSSSIISSVEVIKAPEASTIEGSVGGTINLRTIRPLALDDTLISVRVQGEDSDLSTDSGLSPRLSGSFGDNWDTDNGKFGAVVSLSYIEQDVTAFRPRVDRDGLVTPDQNIPAAEEFPFLRIQFFDQDLDNFEFETFNFAGTFEWAPNDNTKFYFDAIYNDQERRQESSRVQLSGVSDGTVIANTDNQTFETINLGTLNGADGRRNLGIIQAVTSGILFPNQINPDFDPNLRTSSNTGARLTESQVYKLGGEWQGDKLSVRAEVSISQTDSVNPNLSTNLDFINPNTAQPIGNSEDNSVPVIFDLTGGALTFGIAPGLDSTPTVAQLLDPSNYAIRDIDVDFDIVENEEVALRTDFSYDLSDVSQFFTSVDAGFRYNETSSLNDESSSRADFRSVARPTGDLFADLLVAGPDNFDAADGRELFIRDFLVVDPEASFSNPDGVISAFNAAISAFNAANDGSIPLVSDAQQLATNFFDIEEETIALYAQANFEVGIFKGNFGFRYLETDLTSLGNSEQDVDTDGDGVTDTTTIETIVESSSYDFVLPRVNVVANITNDFLIRASYSQDINRPDFNQLSTSVEFPNSSNDAVEAGNPNLVPEEVESFDISAEWYFAESAVASIGVFHKIRTDLFTEITEEPAANLGLDGSVNRDITAPCEAGGIFNPVADRGVNSQDDSSPFGICVPFQSTFNGQGDTTQTGVEVAFQYDLSAFEDKLGWASGFGLIANYTYQEFDAGNDFLPVNGGSRNIFNNLDPFVQEDLSNLTTENILLNLSENSYNITLFYEKYGLTARARYTFRDAFRSSDDDFFGLDVVEEPRAQLNASINYAINDHFTIDLQGINITQSDAEQSCINENALLCFQDLTDRRLLLGVSYTF